MTFLEKLADRLIENYPDKLSGVCIVFPSRRAGLYFRKVLSLKLKKAVWPPDILSAAEFIVEISGVNPTDRLVLIFELFEAYRSLGAEETFESFYPWGEMLLKDFDDINKCMADAEQVFRIAGEHREVEEEFNLFSDADEELKRFWRIFSGREIGGLENDFLGLWKIAGRLYGEFRKRLRDNGYATEGMAYESACSKINDGTFSLRWEKVIFAGLNYLHESERKIMEHLLKQGRAEVYWDADSYYMNGKSQEAGRFISENIRKLKITKPGWIEDNFDSGEKKSVKVIGAPLHVSQAKVLGNELKELLSSKGARLENTAVVLPDENLLIPVLNSITPDIKHINVTMGFPFKSTPLYSLIEMLGRMQKNLKREKGRDLFYHRDVSAVLMNPYIKFIDPAGVFGLLNTILRENIIFVPGDKISSAFGESKGIFGKIFRSTKNSLEMIDYLYGILDAVTSRFKPADSIFENEYFFSLYAQLNRLSWIFRKYPDTADAGSCWKLLLEALRGIRIPFTGEPLKGLQVMGLLETRAIDFDNVFILSMNEDIIPASSASNSFIPYSIRRSFKLPTFEDEDSTYAYYFYRLIQRAKNICLIYNTEVGKVYSGEKSRFLLQVEKELARLPAVSVESCIVENEVSIPEPGIINIEKSPVVIKALLSLKYISASSLSEYINCKLKFYLGRIAGLGEEESVEEALSGASFGSILHGIIRILYEPYKGKVINNGTISDIKEELDKNYDGIFDKAVSEIPELSSLEGNVQGRNLLFKRIIRKLVHKILENDKNDLPFRIVELEKRIEAEIEAASGEDKHKLKLGGRIDRIDEKRGTFRIIDYKTGKFDPAKTKNPEDIFTNPKKREEFQGLFYSYLYSREEPEAKITAGVYALRKMKMGIHFFYENGIGSETMREFEKGLKVLLEEILDPSVPFSQTKDSNNCKYCPFTGICYRERKT